MGYFPEFEATIVLQKNEKKRRVIDGYGANRPVD
jgi:hypothetical protein